MVVEKWLMVICRISDVCREHPISFMLFDGDPNMFVTEQKKRKHDLKIENKLGGGSGRGVPPPPPRGTFFSINVHGVLKRK